MNTPLVSMRATSTTTTCRQNTRRLFSVMDAGSRQTYAPLKVVLSTEEMPHVRRADVRVSFVAFSLLQWLMSSSLIEPRFHLLSRLFLVTSSSRRQRSSTPTSSRIHVLMAGRSSSCRSVGNADTASEHRTQCKLACSVDIIARFGALSSTLPPGFPAAKAKVRSCLLLL